MDNPTEPSFRTPKIFINLDPKRMMVHASPCFLSNPLQPLLSAIEISGYQSIRGEFHVRQYLRELFRLLL